MKKIFNLILAALVIIGAAACTKNNEANEVVLPTEGLSFYAEFVNDASRAYIDDADGDKTWNTIWENGDKVWVDAGEGPYTFTYGNGKFTCTTDGVASLLGQQVTIAAENGGNFNSKAGKKAWSFNGTVVENFTADMTVQLKANTSFFRYTYNGEGNVTITVTPTNGETLVFQYDYGFYNSVTFSGTATDNFVGFWTQNIEGLAATLSYSIDGVKCKEKTLTLYPGKIYNLGELTFPYEASTAWGIVGSYHGWTADTPAAMYTKGDYVVAFNVPGNSQVKFIEIGKGWDGAVGGVYGADNDNPTVSEADTWHSAGTFNILLPATGTYDVYYQPSIGKYNIVEAGTTPEEYVVPTQQYKVYVYKMDNTWTKLNMYSWDAVSNTTYTGSWPGSTASTTETINGYTYSVWQMPVTATDQQIKVIFNDGSNQTGDNGPYTLSSDLYLLFRGTAVSVIEDPNNPEPTVELQARKIYATTTLSWQKMYIYAWSGVDTITATWSGTEITTSTETINGTKYYVYTFDKSLDGSVLSGVVFNNGSAQTVDILNVTLDRDRFFKVLTTKSGEKYNCEEIADPR